MPGYLPPITPIITHPATCSSNTVSLWAALVFLVIVMLITTLLIVGACFVIGWLLG